MRIDPGPPIVVLPVMLGVIWLAAFGSAASREYPKFL
jgi:hypothetical protein